MYVSLCDSLVTAYLNDLLEVVLGAEALHRGQRLPPVPLLDPDVDQALNNSLYDSLCDSLVTAYLVPGPGVILPGGVRERVISLKIN